MVVGEPMKQILGFHEPPPFNCLNIRIPTILPFKGRGFINNHSSTFQFRVLGCKPKPYPKAPGAIWGGLRLGIPL